MFSKGILPCILAAWLFQVATCAPSYDSWIKSVHNDDDSFVRVKRQDQGVVSGASGKPAPVVDNSKITLPINADGQDKSSPVVSLPAAKNVEPSAAAKESKAGDVAPSPTAAPPTITVTEDNKPKEEKISQAQGSNSDTDEGRSQNEPDEIKEAMLIIDGRGDTNYATEDDNMDGGVEIMMNRCSKVRCTPPPNGFECKERSIQVTEPIPQLIGLTSECCPVHVCRRQDGSTFLHYAIEVDDDGSSGNQSPQGPGPQATFSASYSLLSNGNNNGNGMQFPSQHSSNSPFRSSLFPPIFPFFPPASSFSISSNKQQSPSDSSSRNGPPPSFGGMLFPSKSDQESDRFSFPNAASSIQIVLPPSQNGNKYPSPSAGSQRVSQDVLSNSPLISLDRIVRNVAFGAPPAQLQQQFNSAPYQPVEGQRERRNVFVSNWQGLPAGGMPIRPAASSFGGFPMFPF